MTAARAVSLAQRPQKMISRTGKNLSGRVLLLIPSVVKTGVEKAVAQDRHPTMDYWALVAALRARGCEAELLDYKSVETTRLPKDTALALAGFQRKDKFDSIFTNGENVALPLALLLKSSRARPRHVTIGHRLSTPKKRAFFTLAKAHRQIDRIFVYATAQYQYAHGILGIEAARLALISFHADADFFRPLPKVPERADLVSSAGLEWRDYPTLIGAANTLPELSFKLAAASPWSKHRNETVNRDLPKNVDARRYEYSDLRHLYAESGMVVVPLYEMDFQAGVTTILEAMAMGKPVITTRTQGQTDVIMEDKTGVYV
ncbi:MAG TPA: glycosyltransferase, partial [Capsulimonadaceae bacterium]|nr:glycosyltransferase [Capsulimonadaceae bacterium]